MKKLTIFSQIIILSMLLICACSGTSNKKMPIAEKGVLKLNNWDFQIDGPVKLDGEWEFYWKNHYAPDVFLNEHIFPTYYKVPALWNSEEFNDKQLPNTGYATYRLKILLDGPKKKLALMIDKLNTAYTLYVDDTKIYESGKIGKESETTEAWDIPTVVDINAESDIVYITFLVSNFHLYGGGIGNKIQLGNENSIRESHDKSRYATLFLLGIIFIMGVYNLGIFILLRNNKSLLYLGINCLLVGLFLGLHVDRVLFTIFSGMSWSFLYTILLICFHLSLPSFSMFTYSFFPQEFNKTFLKIIIGIGSLFALVSIFNSIKINNFLIIINQLNIIIVGIYITNIAIKGLTKKREGSIIFLTTGLIFFLMIINDLLHYNQLIHTSSAVKYGFAFMVCSLSYSVTFRFSKEFIAADGMSKELEYFKHELEDKVKEKTNDLNSTSEELSLKNQDLLETREELKKVKEILWDELEIEDKIQSSLISNKQSIDGIEVFTYSMPEKSLGGNYYDIIHTQNKTWIIIGDVSGQGIKSGLLMLMVQTAVRAILANTPDITPKELAVKANDLVGRNILIINDEKYIKLTILDMNKGNNEVFSGFHHDTFIYRNSSDTVELIKSNEAWLGISDDINSIMEDDTMSLDSDDIMMIFSYGASELWDKKNIKKIKDPNLEKITTDKMKNFLQMNGKSKLEDIYETMKDELQKYGQSDNITVFLMKKE